MSGMQSKITRHTKKQEDMRNDRQVNHLELTHNWVTDIRITRQGYKSYYGYIPYVQN